VEGDVASGDPYEWTESDHGPFEFGAAVALVKGCSPARALDVLGAGQATQTAPARAVRDWAAQQNYQHYGTAIEAGEISGWTVVIELNGYQATLPELLEALSAGGEAVVIYQNVNGLASFQYAKDGTIVREFDPAGRQRRSCPSARPARPGGHLAAGLFGTFLAAGTV
jgi:hypothetical protein